MEIETTGQVYSLQNKVHENIGHVKDDHQFPHRQFLDIYKEDKTIARPFSDIHSQDVPTSRPFSDIHSQDAPTSRPFSDIHSQDAPTSRPFSDIHSQDAPTNRPFSDTHSQDAPTNRPFSDIHSQEVTTDKLLSENRSLEKTPHRPFLVNESQEILRHRLFPDNLSQDMPTHKSFSTNQSNETLKQFSDSHVQDKSAQRHLMDAERRDFRHYQEIMDEEEKQNHSRNLDDRESVDCDSDDHQYKDNIQKCQDNIEDLRAVIKRADSVSPQVADVVEKVMSEESSLIENQESYNLSNASFHDTNSNSSDTPSDYISSHVTSESTTTYVRDPNTGHITTIKPDKEGLYFCHLCSFSGRTQVEFENHMTCHFEHICPHCDYKSRTEGRLKRHIKDFHTDDPPDGFGSKRNMGRPKVFRCKQCDFVATEKTEFWAHARAHIKDDKVLQCPRCPFVTEYKHHLEYHLRNHFGSKPFKCNKCNYSCVNKSMLNSHMKSHTNVYQYRCADCTYATKYCHSLKLHLRKYNHKPATVLNTDGSLPQGIDADASGLSLLQKRGPPRGPRGPRKDKFDPFMNSMFNLPQSPIHGLPPGMSGAMMSPYWPLLSQLPNGFHRPPPLIPTSLNSPMSSLNSSLNSPQQLPQHLSKMAAPKNLIEGDNSSNHPFTCNFCCYGSSSKQELYKHLMKVHATENQDLFSMFGLSSETLLEEQNRRMSLMKHKMEEERNLDSSVNDELHVQTDCEDDDPKSSPHSWSHPSPVEPAKINRNNRYSMPELPLNFYRNGNTSQKEYPSGEGEDIIQQMMNKFGTGSPINTPRPKIPHQRESPLDLTKRKYPFASSPISQEEMYQREANNDVDAHSSGESTSANENNGQSPRKRSRKGKAFKLDRLCLKLQDKHADMEYDSENEEESEFLEENDDIGQLQIDESRNIDEGGSIEPNKVDEVRKKDDDIEEIKNSLQYLNEGMVKTQTKKVAESKSPDSTRNFLDDNVLSNQNEDMHTSGGNPSVISHTSSGDQTESAGMQTSQALRRGTELAWKMLQNGNVGSMPYTSLEQNGHNHDLAKLTTAAQQMIAINNKQNGPSGKYECAYCEIAFKDCVMYTMHMGYHGYKDPFKCNMCGHCSKDKVDFFLHIARAAHN